MFKWFMLLIYFFRAYGALLYANLGGNVTLPCFYPHSAKNLCWYKQVAGEQPQIISSVYAYERSYNELYNQFKDDTRLSFDIDAGSYKLKISNVQDSDSAMYFCGETNVKVTTFSNGTFLAVKDSSCFSSLEQPASDSVPHGGSVTLNCTLTTGTSDGEHRVYWFKKDTGQPNLGIMHVHTNNRSRCVRAAESESPARRRCVYNLWKERVSLSDDGMYFCAVASCGEVLFGKGMRLNVEDTARPVWVYVVAALLLSVIVNIALICALCKMAHRPYLHSGDSQQSVAVYTTETQNEPSGDLQYVALDYRMKQNKSRRQRSREEETVYSEVRKMEQE